MILLVVFFMAVAAWCFFIAFRPQIHFFLNEGWKFRDAEPSDLYTVMTRLGAAISGIVCLMLALWVVLTEMAG